MGSWTSLILEISSIAKVKLCYFFLILAPRSLLKVLTIGSEKPKIMEVQSFSLLVARKTLKKEARQSV